MEADSLFKTFKDKTTGKSVNALQNVNINIEEGKITALIGPDGAGKTTFLRMVCGLLFPTGGTLHVLGEDITKNPQAVQDQLSYMPQKFGLYEDLTCQENLDLYADLHGIPQDIRRSRFQRLLRMTGLEPFTGRLAGRLSGGMKQKLGLACTLVRSPKLLLLDEPTVGVDPLSRRELWAILKELVTEEQISVLVSTAYMDEAEMCQHIFILNRGKVLAEGTPDTLREIARGHCYTAAPPPCIPARNLQAALLDDRENVIDAVPESGKVRFSVYAPECIGRLKALQAFPGLRPEPAPVCLEDSFMILLRKEEKASENNSEFALDYSNVRPPSQDTVIEVKELVRKFGDFIAVNNTSFQVHEGEIFGLLGPNGAGKSTTFKMLCGLLPATSGFLSVAGVNLRNARTQARTNVGYVAQKFSLYETLTVKENLEFFGGVYGLDRNRLKSRMDAMIRQFDLAEVVNKPAGELPGGYKQRLSMAVGMIHQPRILFLDEPTSGIDPVARRTFWRQITAFAAAGTTIIITTHFMEEAEYCDRIMIQDQGKMLILGTPEEVRQKGGNSSTMNEAFISIVNQNRQAAG